LVVERSNPGSNDSIWIASCTSTFRHFDGSLFNGSAVCIVEVKYKADSNDVLQVLRKERTFRRNFPEHNKKKLYLAMASLSFHPLTEKACKDNGIAIMKQVGDTIVVSDENLKVF